MVTRFVADRQCKKEEDADATHVSYLLTAGDAIAKIGGPRMFRIDVSFELGCRSVPNRVHERIPNDAEMPGDCVNRSTGRVSYMEVR